MATYYINGSTGNDSTGDGSSGLPWKTLDKAITTGGAGTDNTFLFAAGVYEVTVANVTPIGAASTKRLIGLGNVVFNNATALSQAVMDWHTLCFYNISFIGPNPVFTTTGIMCHVAMQNCGTSGAAFKIGIYVDLTRTNCTNIGNMYSGTQAFHTDVPLRCSPSGAVVGNTVVTSMPYAASYSGCFLPLPPTISTTMFSCGDWVNDTAYGSGVLQINATDIQIATGSTSGRALSSVQDFGANTLFRGFGVRAEEVTNIPGGNAVVDSTPATTARTFEYRVSDSTFASGAATPAWISYTRGDSFLASGRYLQYRVTLIQNGA